MRINEKRGLDDSLTAISAYCVCKMCRAFRRFIIFFWLVYTRFGTFFEWVNKENAVLKD